MGLIKCNYALLEHVFCLRNENEKKTTRDILLSLHFKKRSENRHAL